LADGSGEGFVVGSAEAEAEAVVALSDAEASVWMRLPPAEHPDRARMTAMAEATTLILVFMMLLKGFGSWPKARTVGTGFR